MADENKEELKRKKRETKEQIKTLKKQQKENRQEINRIKEESGSSHPSARLTTILVVVFIIILLLLIKFDVGGFGSKVLGPIIGDVPYVNRILPDDATTETAGGTTKEPAKEEKGDEATTEAATEAMTTEAPATTENVDAAEAPDNEGGTADNEGDVDSNLDPTMQSYVDTYSAMAPASAAVILEGMAGDYDLVAEILSNMDAQTRANILAAMSTNNAAKIMKYMENQ